VMRRIINTDGGVGVALEKMLNRGSARYSWAAGSPRASRPAVPPAQEPPAEA